MKIAVCFLVFWLNQFFTSGTIIWGQHGAVRAINDTMRKARSVNLPAPIDCRLTPWSSWSPCGACQTKAFRFRSLDKPSQFGGTECQESQWDEKFCPSGAVCPLQNQCGEMFSCKQTGRCISQHLRCNGEMDCQDGTDEEECEDVDVRDNKCLNLFPIPGSERATQGYNVLTGDFALHILDPVYYGGICEYVYNGEWRKLTYDAYCENLYYNDDEKYYRTPYNFHSYRFVAQARSEASSEYFEDVSSFLNGRKTLDSYKWGLTVGITKNGVGGELGISGNKESRFLHNISQYASQDVGVVRLVSTVQTAQFKMRSRDLVLEENMLQSLMELPEEYDFGSYAQFFQEYGTHHITRGTMGGTLEHVMIVNKEAMRKSEVHSKMVQKCLGLSFKLKLPTDALRDNPVKGNITFCNKIGEVTQSRGSSDSLINDGFTLVKGGTDPAAAGAKIIEDTSALKKWGKSLKYSPDLIDFETLPMYELVRLSTAADQARTRLPHLRRAWEEFLQQYSPCRCAPCRNNGVPALSGTSCSCVCKSGYGGEACEELQRPDAPKQDSVDGSWSCWGSWSSCQSGRKTRRRECNNPKPAGGAPCLGNSEQTQPC
ncbi:complement component C8 alpha chain [Alosa alosa]|nr:complement component C8 alpha chain [Alosa alosa]